MPFRQFHFQNEIDARMGAVQAWRLVVLAILVLLSRRLPIMVAMYRWMPDVKTWREAVFSGHFGPMGIGAIVSTFANQFLIEYMASNPSMRVVRLRSMDYRSLGLVLGAGFIVFLGLGRGIQLGVVVYQDM